MLAGGMKKSTFKYLKWFVNVVTIIFCIVAICLILANSIISLLQRINSNLKIDNIPFFAVLFVIVMFMVIEQTITIVLFSGRLLYIVKTRSLNVSQVKPTTKGEKVQRILSKPYNKIIGLVVGLLLSSYIQILAAIVSALTSLFDSRYHIIDYFLQGFGVLIFAIIVLFLFNPLLNASNESGDVSERNVLSSSRIGNTDSPRVGQMYNVKNSSSTSMVDTSGESGVELLDSPVIGGNASESSLLAPKSIEALEQELV